MPDVTRKQWASALLGRLGIPESHGAITALVGWQRAEGGNWNNDARYNPLNTTQPMKGAGNTGTQGNIKVYKSWDQGLQATVKTLRNGRYGGILKALKAGNPGAVGQAIENSPWGTGGLAAQVIGRTKVGGGGAASPLLQAAATDSAPTTSTRSGDIGQGADILSLLQGLGQAQQPQPRQTAPLQAPSFSAQPTMPQGGMLPASGGGGGGSSMPDMASLLASIATPGGGIQHTTVEGGEATSGGAAAPGRSVKGAVVGSPIAGEKPQKPTHETLGLKGYPAVDYMAKPGTAVVAPVSGKIVRFSGDDPKKGATQGAGGPLGWSIYLKGDDGKTYYLTHLGSRTTKVGARVKEGAQIGTVANYDKYGRPSHVHMGVHG